MSGGNGEAVKVIVRCRPMNTKEKNLNCQKIIKIDQNTLQVHLLKPENSKEHQEPKSFTFDGVYDDDSRQKDVYDDTAYALVNSVIEGYNGTIFAYGQTGCGKTFTMEGVKEVAELRGIIPNTFDQIFNTIAMNPDASKKFLVQASYIEIYNEEVRDLLGDNPKARCDVKEDVERGVFIKGLTKTVVNNVAQINAIMTNGNKNRSVGATLMNADSSRSHSIFTINIETSEPVENSTEERIRAGKLNLVDLAGSERQSKTQAAGDRLKEATKINLSLSALGNVISALVSGKDHIPYRDSKLTRLLQDSLGGNTKTIMIACFSPADYNYEETLSTLRYANRAKNIKNKPKINEDPKDALLREYQDEIKRLKALLEGRGIDTNGQLSSNDGTGSVSKKRGSAAPTDEDGDDEIAEDDADGESKSGANGEVDAVTVAQRKKVKQSRAEMEEDVAAMNVEKERHEHFAHQLEEQMAMERAKLEAERAALEERVAAKDESAIAEIRKHEELAAELEQRMQQERAEHEEQARELAEKMKKEKERHQELVSKLKEIKHQSKEEKQALKEKLKKLQQKMMAGGQTIKDLKLIQEEQARQAAIEAKQAKKQQAMLREEREKFEEEKLLAEENLLNTKDDLTEMKRKMKKLRKKYREMQDEMQDNQAEFESEKEGYLNNIRDIYRELRLYKLICESFLTRPDIEKIVKNSTFDDDRDTWQLPRIDLPVLFPTIRVRTTIPPKPNGIVISKPENDTVAADAGWKKSVVAGIEIDGSPRDGGGKGNMATRLNPMGGGRSRGNSEADDIPRKPFDPADMPDPRKRGTFEPAGIIPETSTASLPTTMPKMRPAFQPAVSAPRTPSPTGITADAHVRKRPAFNPHDAGVDLSPSPTNALDVLSRAPKARANFQPAILTQGEDKDDPLHMTLSRPKFEPAR